jgi:peptide/nickel transport system substrate-binding protein
VLSLPMNEYLQQSFKEIGIDIDFKVVEFETLYTHWRKGAADEMNAGITANNIAYVTSDPLYAIIRFFASDQVAPVKVDALINEAKQTFDTARQDELIAQAHALIVDDAALVWVVHDTNPHALSPRIRQFVQAQHWFQDLTTIGVE